MEKLDLKQQFKQLYNGNPGVFTTVEVPPLNYLMIDGKGYPGTSPEYAAAMQTLYPMAYTLKFMSKRLSGRDFAVMPLEGLWWIDDMTNFTTADKDDWQWTSMIAVPDFIDSQMFDQAKKELVSKKNPPALAKLRLEKYHEGRAAQVLYIGSYADEGPTITALHDYIAGQGGQLTATNKHHHEIYLGDPRRTDPQKLKTIIRQPF